MRSKRTAFIAPFIVIIFLLVALFGLMASVNKYQDQGIGGAVDCDGPLTVLLFLVPSLLVYAADAIYYAVLLKGGKRSLSAAGLMVLYVVMVFAAGKKAWAAYSEQSRPEHQQTCGKGW